MALTQKTPEAIQSWWLFLQPPFKRLPTKRKALSSTRPSDGKAGQTRSLRLSWVQSAPTGARETEQLQANGVGDLSSSSRAQRSGLVEKNLYPLPGTATFNVSASGSGTARLDHPLQPGDYSWRVISAGPAANPKSHVSSPTHHFTVLGPQLRRLRATTLSTPRTPSSIQATRSYTSAPRPMLNSM